MADTILQAGVPCQFIDRHTSFFLNKLGFVLTLMEGMKIRLSKESSIEGLDPSEEGSFVSKKWEPPMPSKASQRIQSIAVLQKCINRKTSKLVQKSPDTTNIGPKITRCRRLFLCLQAGSRMLFVLLVLILLSISMVLFWGTMETEFFGSNPFSDIRPNFITTEINRIDTMVVSNNSTNSSASDIEGLVTADISLPLVLSNIANVELPLAKYDVPFLFHIPRSGSTTIEDIMSVCVGLVVISKSGAQAANDAGADNLESFRTPWGATYVNIDASSINGIIQMREAKFIQGAGLGNLINSQYFYQISSLFNEKQKAR